MGHHMEGMLVALRLSSINISQSSKFYEAPWVEDEVDM